MPNQYTKRREEMQRQLEETAKRKEQLAQPQKQEEEQDSGAGDVEISSEPTTIHNTVPPTDGIITAACSGGLGDIIYAVKVMHRLGVKRLYMKDRALEDGHTTYGVLKDLIEMQGIQCIPTNGNYDFFFYEPGLRFHYDLDMSRNLPQRNRNHIMKSFFIQFGFDKENWRFPWLKVENQQYYIGTNNFALIALTPRWRERSTVNWKRVYNKIKLSGFKEIYFIGFRSDWENFCRDYGEVAYYPTENLLQCLYLINQCRTLYTNQNPMVSLAQGIGKEYFIEHKPSRSNVLTFLKNEHIL